MKPRDCGGTASSDDSSEDFGFLPTDLESSEELIIPARDQNYKKSRLIEYVENNIGGVKCGILVLCMAGCYAFIITKASPQIEILEEIVFQMNQTTVENTMRF